MFKHVLLQIKLQSSNINIKARYIIVQLCMSILVRSAYNLSIDIPEGKGRIVCPCDREAPHSMKVTLAHYS